MQLALSSVSGRHPAALADARPAIEGLTLALGLGEQVAVIGPSGAGKTTLLQLMAAALRPSAGEVLLDGRNPWRLSTTELQKLRGRLFYAPQTPPLPPRQRVVTALSAARLPSMSLGQSIAQLVYPRGIEDAASALAAFDIAEKIWDRVDRLSGGERQRVGLARALMSPASLWLIDEPLSALDPKRALQAITAITESARNRGATLVTTLHQVDIAIRMFPRVIGLRDGKLVFDLPSAQVTPAILAALYAQFEHELSGAPSTPVIDTPPDPQPAKVVHCR